MNTFSPLPRTIRGLAPALLVLYAATTPLTVDAATRTLKVTAFPDLAIKSNGSEYTTVSGIGFAWQGKVELEAFQGRFKRWRLTPVLTGPSTDWPILEMSEYSAIKSYDLFNRPKRINLTVNEQFPPSAVAGFAKALCEDNAERLRRQDIADREIFSKDYKIRFFVGSTFDVDGTHRRTVWPGEAQVEWSPPTGAPSHVVTCLKTNDSPVAAGNQTFGVENALESIDFHIGEESNLSGHCAVNLHGEFRTRQGDSRVDYHFVHHESGRRSAAYSTTTNASRRGRFSHRFDLPRGKNDDGTGSIALVVTNFDAAPSVMSYAVRCTDPGATGFAAELPPILSMEVKEKDTEMVDGQICPRSVSLIAGIKARSDLEGKIVFVGSGFFSEPQPYQLADGHSRQYSETMNVKWETSGGFGSALTIRGDHPKPLKRRRINMGYNLVGADGAIAYQFEGKSFELACRYPQAAPGIQAAGDLATGVHVHWARLTARPESALNGARCGVRINGTLQANAANATVSLAVRDQRGATLARHTVTTDSQKQAHVRDFIDLADAKPDGIGSLTANVANTNDRSGALRLVGTSVKFESNTAPFRLTCHDPAPGGLVAKPVQPGSTVPTMGGALTMRPKQPQAGAAVAAEAKGIQLEPGSKQPSVAFGARQMKPRDDKDEPDVKTAGAMAAKPGKTKPGQKTRQAALQAAAIKIRRADAAVTRVNISARGRVGTVQAKVANRGDADMRGTLVIVVRNGRGRTVANITEPLSMKAGDSRAIQKRFKIGRARNFVADVSVRTGNDANMSNNRKQARVSR